MSQLITKTQGEIYRWREQILTQLEEAPELPSYMKLNFSGLNKDQVIEKLKKLAPHLVVHLGLNYVSHTASSADTSLHQSISALIQNGHGLFSVLPKVDAGTPSKGANYDCF